MEQNDVIGDRFGRRFPYLRLSVADVCNFRCSYCLPDGYARQGCDSFLNGDEIVRLVRVFAGLGVWKIRLTGGEPAVRPDFVDLVSRVSAIDGIERLAFTTNGYRLPQRAQSFFDTGLRAVNISIDSLSAEKFAAITGHDRLYDALDGIDACFRAGFESVKVNTVLLRGMNDGELDDFISFVADRPISLRFIELMRTIDNADYYKTHHMSAAVVRDRLIERGWVEKTRADGAGPAIEFMHPDSAGTVGLIAPYSKDFCKSCNRLRVSARGDLHLCLFGAGGYALRPLLQDDDQYDDLRDRILSLMGHKRESHALHDGDSGQTRHLASIGG